MDGGTDYIRAGTMGNGAVIQDIVFLDDKRPTCEGYMMNWIEAQAQAVKQWGVKGAA